MVRKQRVIFALILGWIAGSATAQTATMHLSDSSGLYAASFNGNQASLRGVSQSAMGAPAILAQALYQRSLYQLDASSNTVANCAAISQIPHSTANWSCALILAGNQVLSGDIAGWAHTMDATKKIVLPIVAAQLHRDPHDTHIAEFEALPDFSAYFDFPKVSVKRDSDTFTVPVTWVPSTDSADNIQPFVTASVNGHALRMAIDTGTSGVILSRQDAALVQVTHIHHDWMLTSQGRATDLGVIENFKIGGVSITNLPATLTTSPVSVIGLRGLQFLRAFRLQGDTLSSRADGYADSCRTPFNMATWVEGSNAALLVPGTVSGVPFPFFLDTGNAWGIVRHTFGNPSENDHATAISLTVGGVNHTTMMAESHDTMQIGEVPSTFQTYRIVYSDQHSRFRYDIGGSYIHQHDLIVDFKHGLMCVK